MKKCSHCNRGEIDSPANFFAKGKTPEGRPYRALLCSGHLDMLLMDGYELREEWVEGCEIDFGYADHLTQKHTGYYSFKRLCGDNATLRVKGAGHNAEAMRDHIQLIKMRKAYWASTKQIRLKALKENC